MTAPDDGNGRELRPRQPPAGANPPIRQNVPVATITTSLETITTDGVTHGSVGTLVIDNPGKRNAMNAAMYLAVPDAVSSLAAEPDLRCVVLRGAGNDAFSAGSDITEFPRRRTGKNAIGYDNAEHLAWAALAAIDVPVIAAIHGPCRGGGIAMALHADLRIAADDSSFAVPPASLGIAYPPEATRRLVALVGPAVAKQLLFTAKVLDATEAHRVGFVQEVLPPADLDDQVARITRRIARLAPLSIRASKHTIDSITADGQDGTSISADDMAASVALCYQSDDFREGVQAFMEKRRPHFRGC